MLHSLRLLFIRKKMHCHKNYKLFHNYIAVFSLLHISFLSFFLSAVHLFGFVHEKFSFRESVDSRGSAVKWWSLVHRIEWQHAFFFSVSLSSGFANSWNRFDCVHLSLVQSNIEAKWTELHFHERIFFFHSFDKWFSWFFFFHFSAIAQNYYWIFSSIQRWIDNLLVMIY